MADGDERRPIEFWGSSLDDIRALPEAAKQDAGYQLHLVQIGKEPTDWKPMKAVGPGAREIRIADSTGVFRIIYVVRFSEAVIVLHGFEKKSQKTSRTDIDLAKKRYREAAKEYGK